MKSTEPATAKLVQTLVVLVLLAIAANVVGKELMPLLPYLLLIVVVGGLLQFIAKRR